VTVHLIPPSLGDVGRTGRRKVEALGPLAFHLQRDLLHVEDDVGDVLADAREAREFMQHAVDLDRGGKRTGLRRECGARASTQRR
jgi:hypothetical protein